MGFYGTLKMIFYKVSRVSALVPTRPPRHAGSCSSRFGPSFSFDATLSATAGDGDDDEEEEEDGQQ